MFAAFNVKLKKINFLKGDFYKKGKEFLKKQKKIIETDLEKYVCKEKYIDGSLLERNWFPQIQCDVFLSHSHKDEKLVIALAGWLYDTLGLTPFVDSAIWGYSDNLLKILDNNNCVEERKNDATIYSYKKRNATTSHVHMMLAMALEKMLDNTEALFFINTPQSIIFEETIKSNQTLSPWIYSEIQMANMLRKQKLSQYRQQIALEKTLTHSDQNDLYIKYDVLLTEFKEIDENDLLYLEKYGKIMQYPLDILYERKKILPKMYKELYYE